MEDKRAVPLYDNGTNNEHQEKNHLDNVHKEEFFNLSKIYRIKIKTLFSKPLTLRDKHAFNIFLKTIKEKHGIRIMDSLVYIEEGYARFNQMVKALDQENTYLVKVEATEFGPKYKMDSNCLDEILEFE